MRKKLTVKRAAYTKSTGTVVGATIYKTADKGKVGRTSDDKKWYHPRVHTGWHKTDPATTRRRRAIIAHKSNRLAAGRGLQALANTTVDKTTKRLAALDARYLFKMYKKYGNK
jgi:hypothetical protein